MKVSYSGLSEYKTCGIKYKINRIDKIRPIEYSSAFFFGSAIDAATEAYLLDTACPYETFKTHMESSEYNRKKISIPKSENIKYYSTDLDFDLLTDEDWDSIEQFSNELEVVDFFRPTNKEELGIMSAYRRKKLSSEQKKVLNYASWLSLSRKGCLIIEELCKWVDENIEETISCQKEIKLENEDGDILRGYLDFEAKFKDGVVRTVDLKTASDPNKQYPDGCASESVQLTIYAEAEAVSDVAYLVLDKRIRKRDPRVRIKYIPGKIEPQTADKVFNQLEEDLAGIKSGVFQPNWDACKDYGGCPYYNYCRQGSMEGLEKLEN